MQTHFSAQASPVEPHVKLAMQMDEEEIPKRLDDFSPLPKSSLNKVTKPLSHSDYAHVPFFLITLLAETKL